MSPPQTEREQLAHALGKAREARTRDRSVLSR
jgi:hypothetical protein